MNLSRAADQSGKTYTGSAKGTTRDEAGEQGEEKCGTNGSKMHDV